MAMKLKKNDTPAIASSTEVPNVTEEVLTPAQPQENLEVLTPVEEPILKFPLTWFRGGVTPTKTVVARGTKAEIQSWFNARYRDKENKGWIYPIPRSQVIKDAFENDPNCERLNRNPERTTAHLRVKNTNMKAWYPLEMLPNTKLVPNCYNVFVQDQAPMVEALDPMDLPETAAMATEPEFSA